MPSAISMAIVASGFVIVAVPPVFVVVVVPAVVPAPVLVVPPVLVVTVPVVVPEVRPPVVTLFVGLVLITALATAVPNRAASTPPPAKAALIWFLNASAPTSLVRLFLIGFSTALIWS